jgi:tetratricopeptide (TPR) repeat protein
MKTVRIFLSSPGDVGAEREKAREIFDRLQVEFSGLIEIAPYFWEHEPMRANADFQSQIEPPSKFDVFVCLLWARLGSRLHPGLHQKPGGGEYASGTEYELLDAMEAFRRSSAPEVLIYKREGDPVIPAKPKEERERILSQYDALESFFARLTQEDGHFVVGTNSYTGLEQFEMKFEGDMRKVLARFVPEGVEGSRSVPKSWAAGSPFRGLRHFDFEHAPIFFGRTRAVDEVLAALRRQAADERAFILVFGGSGVGKSSLVRAGVLPWLIKPGVIDGVGLWRRAVMRPNEVNEGDLFDALATALMRPEGLPEIGSDGTSVTQLAAMLREKPEGVGLLIKGALSQAAREVQLAEKLEKQPRALVALAVDQLEELFTIERLAGQREGFLRAIDALARSGYVWVLATLRSDFYPRCEESPLLMELKKGAGQYHLQPPDEAQLGQMIRLPASAAGLLFEEDHKTGERLDDLLRDAAVKSPGALPLLEFALEELYEQRDKDKGLLKLDAYRALGGVEGALGQRAEESFQHAGASAQESFDLVFRQLVTISAGEGEPAVRRRARKDEVESSAGARELIAGLTTDRLLVADRTEEGVIVIGLAHEAMLSSWPRLAQWVQRNRDSLKVRAQVAADSNRWIENNRNRDYLYDAGLPLEKARAAQREGFLDQRETEFVEASGRHVAAEASRRVRVLRRGLVAVGVVAIIAVGAGVLAWQKKREAVAAKKAADALIRYMQYDLSEALEKLGYLRLMEGLNAKIRKYHEDHPAEAGDSAAEAERREALDQQGGVLMARGDLAGALKSYHDGHAINEKLARLEPKNAQWQRELAVSYTKIADVLNAQGDLAGALQNYRKAVAILETLTAQNPANTRWQRDLSAAYSLTSAVLSSQGDLAEAFLNSRNSLTIREKLTKQDPANAGWQRDLLGGYRSMGDILQAQGDLPGAVRRYHESLALGENLLKQDPSNADWQAAVAGVYASLGDALMVQRDFRGALQNYRDGVAIAQKLAKQDPFNADWQRDLSASYLRVGDALSAQGDLSGALQSYRDALAINEKLTKQEPSNAGWQLETCALLGRVAQTILAMPKPDRAEAQRLIDQGLAIMAALDKKHPLSSSQKETRTWLEDMRKKAKG